MQSRVVPNFSDGPAFAGPRRGGGGPPREKDGAAFPTRSFDSLERSAPAGREEERGERRPFPRRDDAPEGSGGFNAFNRRREDAPEGSGGFNRRREDAPEGAGGYPRRREEGGRPREERRPEDFRTLPEDFRAERPPRRDLEERGPRRDEERPEGRGFPGGESRRIPERGAPRADAPAYETRRIEDFRDAEPREDARGVRDDARGPRPEAGGRFEGRPGFRRDAPEEGRPPMRRGDGGFDSRMGARREPEPATFETRPVERFAGGEAGREGYGAFARQNLREAEPARDVHENNRFSSFATAMRESIPRDDVPGDRPFRDREGGDRPFRDREGGDRPFRDREGGGFRDREGGGFRDREGGGFRDRESGGFRDREGGGFRDREGGGFRDREGGGFRDREGGGFRDREGGGFRDSRFADRGFTSTTSTLPVSKIGSGKQKSMSDYMAAKTKTETTHRPVETATDASVSAPVSGSMAAASMGLDVAKTTLAVNLSKLLDDVDNLGGKDAEKKMIADVRAMAGTPELAVEAVKLTALRSAVADRHGDRKQLAGFINLLRGVKPAVFSDEQVSQGVEAACQQLVGDASVESIGQQAEFVADFLTELIATPPKVKGKQAYPQFATDALLEVSAEVLAAGSKALKKPAAAEEASEEALEAPAQSWTAPAVPSSWADASDGKAAAPKSTDAAAAPTRDIKEVAAELAAGQTKGKALVAAVVAGLSGYPNRVAAASFFTAVLQKAHASQQFTAKAPWSAPDEYGLALSALCHGKTDCAVAGLYALQAFLYEVGFQKGLLSNVFMQLYQNDVIDEDSFRAWRDDVYDSTPGKEKALSQSKQFFDYLDEDDEDSGEDTDPEVRDALKDIIRPNNMNKLR